MSLNQNLIITLNCKSIKELIIHIHVKYTNLQWRSLYSDPYIFSISIPLRKRLHLLSYFSYKENIIKLYSVMRDQIQSPLERAVWWTEYVLRHHGADYLRAPTANLPGTEYYEIELVLFVVTSIILTLGIFSLAILYTLRIVVGKSKID